MNEFYVTDTLHFPATPKSNLYKTFRTLQAHVVYSSVFEDSAAYHQLFWGTFCHPYKSSAAMTLYIWHKCLQKEGDCPFHSIIIKTAPIPKTIMLDLSKFTIKSIRLAVLNRTFSWVWRPLTISDNKTTSWERWGSERERERELSLIHISEPTRQPEI